MKKAILVLPCFFFIFSCAQNGNKKLLSTVDKFVTFYNQQQYDSIFNMFDAAMQSALPLDKSREFFSGLMADAGQIRGTEFKSTYQTYRQYKTFFSKAVLLLSISEDEAGKINGLFVKPFEEEFEKVVPGRNRTTMILPFNGEWFVFWGGDTKEQNYHIANKAQKNAFDIVMVDEKGKSYKTNGLTNDDYYAFGQPLIAPCDAEVVLSVDGVKDNKPGEMNTAYVPGNSVILKTSHNEYLLFAHFKQYSIKVKQGDKVKKGQLLGLCGNSGNSSEPHLHFHIQDEENMLKATGIKCYFEKILVNGEAKTDYSPVKGERIKNVQ